MRGPRGPKGPYQDVPRETEEEPAHPSTSDYHGLPMGIKAHVTPKEYQWMGNYARDRLIEDFTQPQGIED